MNTTPKRVASRIYRTGDPDLNGYYRLADRHRLNIERPSGYGFPVTVQDGEKYYRHTFELRRAHNHAKHDALSQKRIRRDRKAST